jgi:hypothetical protein
MEQFSLTAGENAKYHTYSRRVGQVLREINMNFSYNPARSILSSYSREMKAYMSLFNYQKIGNNTDIFPLLMNDHLDHGTPLNDNNPDHTTEHKYVSYYTILFM